MPSKVYWVPKRTYEDELLEEQLRVEALGEEQAKLFAKDSLVGIPFSEEPIPTVVEKPSWQLPELGIAPIIQPVQTQWTPRGQTIPVLPEVTPVAQTITPTIAVEKKPAEVPFWQRALQVFFTPFQWIDDYIIKPGLSQLGTTMGFVPEVQRQPGEDYWEWKKRSWAGWKAPGFDINVSWRDEPWRVDLKGVMELAPWLLIPGAGQVGTGARAARGIAGLVGKIAKPLGYAIEYSPWGLVEKTAGAAMKGGIKLAGKGGERISTKVGEKLFGKIPEPLPPTPTITKFTNFIKETVLPQYKQFKKLKPEEVTARQEARVREVWAKYRKGEILPMNLTSELNKARAVGSLKEKFAIGAEARQFTANETKELLDAIAMGAESGLVKADSATAMLELLTEGKLPFPHNVRDWAKVYGNDFAKAVSKLKGVSPDKVTQFIDILNIGRSVQSSIDLSGTLRQGLILTLLHPTKAPVWFGRQVKALLSEKWSLEIDDVMRAHPQFNEIIGATEGYIAPIREATLNTAEELFASKAARVIPGIRRSERAFVTYLNQARWTALRDGYGAMMAQGATPEALKLFGRAVNIFSGRGEIPKSLEKFAPVLNAMLFSPRLQAATLQLPRQIGRMLISKNPYMRKEAAKALITFVGGGVGLLSLINATGNKVETDPRSGDFGKIKVGETRLDIWRGYLQYARFAAQMLTGERKSAYGNMNKVSRAEITGRFLQSKSSPAFGLMVDLLRGETYEGNPIFNDTTGFSKAARERVIPLALQDVIDAMEQSGINGLWVAAPATLGVGALTYVNDFVRIKQKIAREAGYDSWDDIDPITQRKIENSNAALQAAEISFDRQVMDTAWGQWRLTGKTIDDNFRDLVNKATAQYRETGDGVQFRKKISDAWTARRGGYDTREKMPQFEDIIRRLQTQDTAEALVGLGPEQLAIRLYNEALYGDDMYDEFGDYRFDEAETRKIQLKQQLGEEMFNYVEEYQGMRYEDLPVEFQELRKAKTILRPYWQVEDRAIKQLGIPKTEWQQRRLNQLVSKVRLQMRRNTEIARAYDKFYKQKS